MTVTLEAPPDQHGEHELAANECAEEAALLRGRIQDRLDGGKGVLLEDYWAVVLAKWEARPLRDR